MQKLPIFQWTKISYLNFILAEKPSIESAVPVSTSANGSLPSTVNTLHISPPKTSQELPQNERSLPSWVGTTKATRRNNGEEEAGEVFTPSTPLKSFSKVETEGEYELKAWPRKSGRFRSVVDTVRSLRSRTVSSAPASFSGAENTSGQGESTGQGSQMEGKDKSRNTSSVLKGNSIRKKFSFLKERRQRSVSEGHLGVLYSSQDDMDGMRAANSSKSRALKKLMRRSSENITGSTTLSRERSPEKCFHSLPNSPIFVTSSRDRFKRYVGQRNSRSTASCSSNSQGSSTTQEKCPACDFNVLILSECPDCKASQQENSDPSPHERLIL